jgi:exopolyphosphatase
MPHSYTSLLAPRRLAPCLKFSLLSTLFLPPLVIILVLIIYLDPLHTNTISQADSEQYMRLCLPFSLHRISTAAHQRLTCQGIANGTRIQLAPLSTKIGASGSTNTTSMSTVLDGGDGREAVVGRLGAFLLSQKESFVQDIKDGRGRGWVLAMGNEAGGEHVRCTSRT